MNAKKALKPALVVVCGLIAAMWVYALFFASKESVNKIGDRAWQDFAEQQCAAAEASRATLADLRRVDKVGTRALAIRADIVDKATDTLQSAIDAIANQPVVDDKGRALVPLWIADYRTYIADRRAYADDLRKGVNRPFAETQVEGIPISEKLSTFAADNRMASCTAPIDLSV